MLQESALSLAGDRDRGQAKELTMAVQGSFTISIRKEIGHER
jgi:hypothetical protein